MINTNQAMDLAAKPSTRRSVVCASKWPAVVSASKRQRRRVYPQLRWSTPRKSCAGRTLPLPRPCTINALHHRSSGARIVLEKEARAWRFFLSGCAFRSRQRAVAHRRCVFETAFLPGIPIVPVASVTVAWAEPAGAALETVRCSGRTGSCIDRICGRLRRVAVGDQSCGTPRGGLEGPPARHFVKAGDQRSGSAAGSNGG